MAASAVEAALLTQHIRLLNRDVKIMVAIWAMSDELITFGGAAIEGMVSFSLRDTENPTESYKIFNAQYIEQFGKDGSSDADLGYETAIVLFDALSRVTEGVSLKEALINRRYSVLHEDIFLNQYGDPNREYHVLTVRNGELVTINP